MPWGYVHINQIPIYVKLVTQMPFMWTSPSCGSGLFVSSAVIADTCELYRGSDVLLEFSAVESSMDRSKKIS